MARAVKAVMGEVRWLLKMAVDGDGGALDAWGSIARKDDAESYSLNEASSRIPKG